MKELTQNILIISYPRSGNTFLRNIFMEVFGLFSWNSYDRYLFLRDAMVHPGVRDKDRFFLNDRPMSPESLRPLLLSGIFKTHELPEGAQAILDTRPFIIYLVRDGRDAVVSEAYHRRDITSPGSHLATNLREAILAEGGSHFGGWSANVNAWIPKADLVIHFEQLITQPEICIRKLVSLMPLPDPAMGRIPTFESQRRGDGHFISHNRQEKYADAFPKLFFRKGKAGGWRDDLSHEMHQLFVTHHGATLASLGYSERVDVHSLKYRI